MSDIAVIITCHESYLKWLPEAINSIHRQMPAPRELVVVFDTCQPPALNNDRWRCIQGDWGHPSDARNAGITVTKAPWLIFWDADNIMPDGYIAAIQHAIRMASSDVAIIYPDIQICDEWLKPQTLWTMPAWDYWGMRAENCIDTAAAWRRKAIDIVGGWSNRTVGAFEDYALALDITALGWKAMKLSGPPIIMRIHPRKRMQQRWSDGGALTDLWMARSLAIVSLLAGRDDTFGGWVNFLLHAELPAKTALYVVDNSGRPEFTQMTFEACQKVVSIRRLSHVNFAAFGQPYQPAVSEPYLVERRHLHIAQLYASVFPRVIEDLVFTLEDDVEPPLDAVRRLGQEMGYPSRGNIGAVAAAYAMPQNENDVCAGLGNDEWGPTIKWEHLPNKAIDVGCVGGGCTVWANWALRSCPVHLWWDLCLGWDAIVCIQMRHKGYRIRLHGGVRCQHHLHGQVKDG